jgi:hypothetical protein
MRRTLMLLALGACLVAAAVLPAAALAHHGHHRNRTISGTVASFDHGMLAIKKDSGKVFTAPVTGRTEIECENENENEANDSRLAHASHDGGGDDRGDDNENENEVDNENENEDQADTCDDSDLKPGTVVTRARLRDRHGTDFWKNLKVAS